MLVAQATQLPLISRHRERWTVVESSLRCPPVPRGAICRTIDDTTENYISIKGLPSRATPRSHSIGNDFALVYLGVFGEGDTLRFTIENVKAQTEIETTAFKISLLLESAGGTLNSALQVQQTRTGVADDADLLLGAVYYDSRVRFR